MDTRRVFALVKKDLKKTIREPAMLFLLILFPVMMTLMFGISFGSIGGNDRIQYTVGVVDMNAEGPDHHWSHDLLGNLTLNDLLNVKVYSSNGSAQDALSKGELQAVMVIPANFGTSCNSFVGNPGNTSAWVKATIQLYLDRGSMVATQAIPPIAQQALASTLVSNRSQVSGLPVTFGSGSLVEVQKRKTFDYMAPGLFAFGTIYLIMSVAQTLTVERDEGLLRRLSTTPMTATELMTSQVLSNMVLALFQGVLIFMMAFAVGYRPDTGPAGLAMAFLLVSVFSLCCVGCGLITAALSKSAGAATGISFLFILPMLFLGTFMTGMSGGGPNMLNRMVPSFYLTDSLTNLFLRGAPISSPLVLTDLAVLTVASVIVFVLGILAFRKFGTR